jgi:hypothetical protein
MRFIINVELQREKEQSVKKKKLLRNFDVFIIYFYLENADIM